MSTTIRRPRNSSSERFTLWEEKGSLLNSATSAAAVALFLVGTAGCSPSDGPAEESAAPTTLTLGFGLASGENIQAGAQGLARSIALEPLINLDSRDGRVTERLAERWSTSADGLTLTVSLRSGVKFHDGTPLTAALVREILTKQLPDHLGPVFQDVANIQPTGDHELQFSLRRRSTLLLEGLDVLVYRQGLPSVGTGPFVAGSSGGAHFEMRANESYYLGKPLVDRILVQPYASVRSAWADMLRGEVDVLYEVGQDALDLLQGSSLVEVFTYDRPYSYVVIFNVKKPAFRNPAFRRALNAAIDRNLLVKEVFKGHGTPATGPVWPNHWAYDPSLPKFEYDPKPISDDRQYRFTCLFADSSLERLTLSMQKQLQAIGVDVDLEMAPIDEVYKRIMVGDFDAVLADAGTGPNLLRPYLFWHSGGPYNWGKFNSSEVDNALDSIRHAQDANAYVAGVAAFQRAIIADPPGIFLTWSQRARAVSTRFHVAAEPGRDILSTLRLWRPVGDQRLASRN